ncbi:MAG: hypothetical protein HS117_23525 [Verrucomicrobiaceae bacterium]|nr:hypothetical protein [Verrucomicrobiaceae bacterium]
MSLLKNTRRLAWLLAVWEAFLMLWLLMVCWFILSVILRHPEIFDGVKVSEESKPAMTKLALQLMPQHVVGLFFGLPGLAVGFAAVTMVSGGSLSGRLFRWLIVLIATFAFAAFLPLADRVLLLCGGPEAPLDWSEVLVALVGISAAWAGILHAKRRWK